MGFYKDRYDKQQIAIELYRSGIAVSAIMERFGITRPTFYNWLKDNNVKPSRKADAPNVSECPNCAKTVQRWRGLRKSAKAFCSPKCYFDARKNASFVEWRHGTRIARKVVSAVFHLRAGYVVHHINNDETDNRLENLAVFASQSDHLSFHHNRPGHAEPIIRWDGIPIPPKAIKPRINYYSPRIKKVLPVVTPPETVTSGDTSLIIEPVSIHSPAEDSSTDIEE